MKDPREPCWARSGGDGSVGGIKNGFWQRERKGARMKKQRLIFKAGIKMVKKAGQRALCFLIVLCLLPGLFAEAGGGSGREVGKKKILIPNRALRQAICAAVFPEEERGQAYPIESRDLPALRAYQGELRYRGAGGDLSGLAYLENLESLVIESASLRGVRLAVPPRLKKLNLQYCDALEEVSFQNAAALLELSVSKAPELRTLDLSGCFGLKRRSVQDCDSLGQLDFSECRALQSLTCEGLPHGWKMDLSGCPHLKTLTCSAGNAELDLSVLPELCALNCKGENIKAIKMGAKPCLTSVWLRGLSIEELDLSGCSNLTELHVEDTPLKTIDPAACPELETLVLYQTQVKALDISKNSRLLWLNFSGTPLEHLIVRKERAQGQGESVFPVEPDLFEEIPVCRVRPQFSGELLAWWKDPKAYELLRDGGLDMETGERVEGTFFPGIFLNNDPIGTSTCWTPTIRFLSAYQAPVLDGLRVGDPVAKAEALYGPAPMRSEKSRLRGWRFEDFYLFLRGEETIEQIGVVKTPYAEASYSHILERLPEISSDIYEFWKEYPNFPGKWFYGGIEVANSAGLRISETRDEERPREVIIYQNFEGNILLNDPGTEYIFCFEDQQFYQELAYWQWMDKLFQDAWATSPSGNMKLIHYWNNSEDGGTFFYPLDGAYPIQGYYSLRKHDLLGDRYLIVQNVDYYKVGRVSIVDLESGESVPFLTPEERHLLPDQEEDHWESYQLEGADRILIEIDNDLPDHRWVGTLTFRYTFDKNGKIKLEPLS